MIREIGYKNTGNGAEVEFKCHKLNEYDLSAPAITTGWCVNNCPHAMKCSQLENIIMREEIKDMPGYKRLFVAMKLVLEDQNANLDISPDFDADIDSEFDIDIDPDFDLDLDAEAC